MYVQINTNLSRWQKMLKRRKERYLPTLVLQIHRHRPVAEIYLHWFRWFLVTGVWEAIAILPSRIVHQPLGPNHFRYHSYLCLRRTKLSSFSQCFVSRKKVVLSSAITGILKSILQKHILNAKNMIRMMTTCHHFGNFAYLSPTIPCCFVIAHAGLYGTTRE